MANDLNTAFHGVYASAREIIRNKQRHLYVNMLDLLARTTRASGITSTTPLNDEYVKFWLNDILPLVFDNDKAIQDSAIAAFETIFPFIEPIEVQAYPEWSQIKAIIVQQYTKNLHDFRQAANSNWYKIWCLLVRILNKDILKGASTINTFLQIVEMGFRSSDYGVRAEAFLCWKFLIEVFAKFNEIFSPKRIKLICIPLKSSQSKSLETATNKFKVWWTFLCKIASRLDEYLEIYESFLLFCFGSKSKEEAHAQVKIYGIVSQMAIACLVASLGTATKEVQIFMASMGLEQLTQPLITKTIMEKYGTTIVNICFDVTLLACESPASYGKQIEALWKNLGQRLIEAQNLDHFLECFNQLKQITDSDQYRENLELQRYFPKIMEELIAGKELPLGDASSILVTKVSDSLIDFLQAILKSNIQLGSHQITSISQLFALEKLVQSPKYWSIQKTIIAFVMANVTQSQLALALWKTITHSLVEYLKVNLFEFRINENAKILNAWIVWPIEQNMVTNCDENFSNSLQQIMEAGATAQGKSVFAKELTPILQSIFERGNFAFPMVCANFIRSLDRNFDTPSKPSVAFELIDKVLSSPEKPAKNAYTVIVEALTSYLTESNKMQIIDVFPELKKICTTIVERDTTNAFTKRSADDFKRVLQEKLKSTKQNEKKFLKEIKDLLKKNSQFVIIPNVWSMNPDRLTEHQKEKMKEKRNDIPALYNDISNSQDSSIKPWTPKKIVIARSESSGGDIVIANNDENEMETEANQNDQDMVQSDQLQTTIVPVVHPPEPEFVRPAIPPINSPPAETQKSSDDGESTSTADKRIEKKRSRKSLEPKQKKAKTARESEGLIEKLKIKNDVKKNKVLRRELKLIEIDTIEGNPLKPSRFRQRRSLPSRLKDANVTVLPNGNVKKQTSTATPVESSTEIDPDKRDNVKRSRKSLVFKAYQNEEQNETTDNPETKDNASKNDVSAEDSKRSETSDEVIEASQTVTESILAKKVAARKSFISTNNTEKLKAENISELPTQIDDDKIIESSPTETNEQCIDRIETDKPDTAPIRSENKDEEKTLEHEMEKLLNSDNHELNALQPELSDFDRLLAETTTRKISISQQETEPNTLLEATVSEPIANASGSDKTPSKDHQNQTTEKLTSNDLNCSIRSSPELKDADERNTEFLNNTLNISPIVNGSISHHCNEPTSPKKASRSGLHLPISPPDRKSANTIESPVFRPKHQLTGRGAQLINLIRNKRHNDSAAAATKPQPLFMTPKTDDKNSVPEATATSTEPIQNSPPKKDQVTSSTVATAGLQTPYVPVPEPAANLLVFSKILPSPHASPSASILKRKYPRRDSFDDIESPVCKRKRVSFHDPPVSLTKEYVKDSVEDNDIIKPCLSRCIFPERTSTPNSSTPKNSSFKRKSRADSMLEIANFSPAPPTVTKVVNGLNSNRSISVEMDSLRWNNTTANAGDPIVDTVDERCLTPSPSLAFANEEDLLKHVLEKYSLDTLLERYADTGKSIRAVTNKLSSIMSKDTIVKRNVLDILSEQHPREFLEHAIQENLSFVVCDRLNFNSIVEFVCEKSKLNEDCRRNFLERIQTLLSVEKLSGETQQLSMSLLKNHRMNDREFVDFIKRLVDRQQENRERGEIDEMAT